MYIFYFIFVLLSVVFGRRGGVYWFRRRQVAWVHCGGARVCLSMYSNEAGLFGVWITALVTQFVVS